MRRECPQREALLRMSQVQLGVSPMGMAISGYRTVWGEQPMFPIAPSVAKFASGEQTGVLARSALSSLAGQAERHRG